MVCFGQVDAAEARDGRLRYQAGSRFGHECHRCGAARGSDVEADIMVIAVSPPGPLEMRVVAEQFAWNIQYPGPDGVFGKRDIKLVTSSNPLEGTLSNCATSWSPFTR